MPDAPHILISGYYGYANPGDEAILAVLLSQLRRRLPDVTISVISGNPQETAATHNVEAILWSDPAAIAVAVKASDLVITGGGGILHDYGGVSPQGLFTEGNWGIAFHVTAGLLAGVYSKPLAIYGVGVGPLFSQEARDLTRALCSVASVISVRDEASLQLLRELGVDDVQLTADPGFLLDSGPKVSKPDRVIVVVRHWAHEVDQSKWEQELASGLDLYLERHGGEVVFLPFQQFPGEAEDDAAASRRVHTRMRLQHLAHIWEGTPSVSEKAALIAGCRLVVAMRLHAVIFALREGVPVVALTYDEKVRQVVHRAGYQGVEMADVEANRILQRMEQALSAPVADVSPLLHLATRNTDLAIEALQRSPRPLPLAMLHQGLESLLSEQKKLRHWLSDQKTNFEYQITVQQREIADLRQNLGSEQQLRLETEQRLAETSRQLAETEVRLSQTEELLRQTQAAKAALEESLAAMTLDRDTWRASSERLEQEKAAAEAHGRSLEAELAAWKQLHQDTLRDWDTYATDLDQRLTEYRGQRAWRGMLALRKAYVIWTRQGLAGKLKLLPWALSVLIGRGAVETEQLEFPLRPRPRKL